MGLEALPSTGLLDSGAFGASFNGAIQVTIWFLNLAMLPIIALIAAMVLYYFTGEKKKADEFMPRMMGQVYRLFVYIWLFLISLFAYSGVHQMFDFILKSILPERDTFGFGSTEPDSIQFVQGLMLTLLMLLFAALIIMLNRKVVEQTKQGSELIVRFFAGFGLVIFSIILFVSSSMFITEFVNYLDDTELGLPSGNLTGIIVSSIFFGIYLMKSMKLLKKEK